MWEQFVEQLVPLLLIVILYVLFKFVIPKMLSKNTSVIGMLVANIIAQLFGEGDNVVKGVTELDLVKLIKLLPAEVQEVFAKIDKKVQEAFRKTNNKLNDVTELIALLSQAMMAERLLKPQSSKILQEIKAKADIMLAKENEFVDDVVEEDKTETEKAEV